MTIGDRRSATALGLPHFIMIGAPKCGTTSMHAMLARHPDVFMPDNEVFFFDVDDVMAHPDFFVHRDGLSFHDYDGQFDEYLAWYRSLFAAAKPGQLVGEDTTTYLRSPDAPRRIEALLPDARLIAMLRDPVDRAYSQYLHNVRAGRHSLSFERTLRTNPAALLAHGFYAEQLARYEGFLDAGQLHVVFFEDLIADPRGELQRVCDFLGLDDLPPEDEGAEHSNPARPPIHMGSRLLVNHWLGHRFSFPRPRPNLPNYRGPQTPDAQARKFRWYEGAFLTLDGSLPVRRPPPMNEETRSHLQKVFAKRNAGLERLLSTNVSARWPYMPQSR
ncbi:MAG: sulfotransferase [Polyangiales bacterium]